MLECDKRLYEQSYSHSDKEYLRLLRHRRQLQKVTFIDFIAPHIYTLCIKVFVYYHHRKECLHSEIGTEKSKFVRCLFTITNNADMLNTDLDLVSDFLWEKNTFFAFFKNFVSLSLCMFVWVCVYVCVAALYWARWAPCRVWKGYSSDEGRAGKTVITESIKLSFSPAHHGCCPCLSSNALPFPHSLIFINLGKCAWQTISHHVT